MERSLHSHKRVRPARDVPGRKRIVSSGILSRLDQHQNNENTELSADANTSIIDDDEEVHHLTKKEFEDSIKLATNNKITYANIWDIKLIEYFYDMKELRADDGVSINFQTASTTLDGCTKVISKRVDSVSNDTDSLMQIIKMNEPKRIERKKKGTGSDDESEEEDDKDEDYDDEKEKKKARGKDKSGRNSKDPYIKPFTKMKDTHVNPNTIDPIFTRLKTESVTISANSLLMNSLRMTQEGFITFDELSTAEPLFPDSVESLEADKIVKEEISDEDKATDELFEEKHTTIHSVEVEDEKETISLLRSFKYLVDYPGFLNLEICDDIKEIKKSVADLDYGRAFVNKINEKIEKEENEEEQQPFQPPKFDFDYDIENFELGGGFEEDNNGGFDLSEMTNLDTKNTTVQEELYQLFNGDDDDKDNNHDISMLDNDKVSQKEAMFMAELDQISNRKSLRSQHWKIRAIRERHANPSNSSAWKDDGDRPNTTSNISTTRFAPRVRKPNKNEELIDFMTELTQHEPEELFKKPRRALSTINPDNIKVDETTIPDIELWSSEKLVKSFLKPNRRLATLFTKKRLRTFDADDKFWAEKYNDNNKNEVDKAKELDVIGGEAADFLYDAIDKKNESAVEKDEEEEVENHHEDDGAFYDPGGYDFDAPVTDVKPEIFRKPLWHKDSIQYEKRSKKINVRLLKQNLWDVTKHYVEIIEDDETPEERTKQKHIDLKLSDIVKDTYQKYEGREKSDLSTSFFFICMLHIANEEGLSIDNTDDLKDLIIHT